jgi:hypothetical protein
MRYALFRAVGSFSSAWVGINLGISNMLIAAVAGSFNAVNSCIRWLARSAMKALDDDRFTYWESVTTQQKELGELHLLMAASQVKEDALSRRVWMPMHTIAINRIAGQLHFGCGWEPPRIHQYLREVVESIPGMQYMGGDDFQESGVQ